MPSYQGMAVLRGVHHMSADQVEECQQLLRQSMRSVSYECLAHLPTCAKWLDGQDWTGAYRRHRRNLQLIGLPDADKRWVLKNPSHLFALIVQTHRAPSTIIASVCGLTEQASAGWSTAFRGPVVGRDQVDTWARGLERFTAERARHDQARFFDVDYHDFVAAPLRAAEGVYQHFGLPLSEQAKAGMRRLHEQSTSGQAKPAHRYTLADFALTSSGVDARFGGYPVSGSH